MIQPTLDLSKLSRITSLTVTLYSNGTLVTYTQAGVRINKLSGNWNVIHKITPLILPSNRREFIEKEYGDTLLPAINFRIAIVKHSGETEAIYELQQDQILHISKFIKK